MRAHASRTKTTDPPQRKPLPAVTQAPNPIIQLHGMIGNQTVMRMLSRRPGQTPRLVVGEADPLEHEAALAAERLAAGPATSAFSSKPPGVQRAAAIFP